MIIKDSTRFVEMVKEAKATTPEEKITLLEKFLAQYSFEEWSKLGNDPEKILNDVRETTEIFCDQIIARELRIIRSGETGLRYSSVEDGSLVFDEDEIFKDALGLVDEHRIFFNHEKDDEIDEIIRKTVEESVLTFRIETDQDEEEVFFLARYPSVFISTIDRVSWKTFDGTLNDGRARSVETIHRTKNHPAYYANVRLDLSDLHNMDIEGIKEITPFDREVHDAIITSFVAGNVFITINMIYQTVTGKKDSHCSPSWNKAIWTSIKKLRHSEMWIDASDEAIRDKRITSPRIPDSDSRSVGVPIIDAFPTREVVNGQLTLGIALRSTPILFLYSNQKNQIARFEMKLLDTPVKNKTPETIVIEGYLRRRIKMIISDWERNKNHDDSKRVIKYETIYSLVDFSGCKSPEAKQNKKKKIRDHVKKTLDFYVEQKVDDFISGYEEHVENGKTRPSGVKISFRGTP